MALRSMTRVPVPAPFNAAMVGKQGDSIVILNPPVRLSKEQALMFAAFIVVLATDDESEFNEYLVAVQSV